MSDRMTPAEREEDGDLALWREEAKQLATRAGRRLEGRHVIEAADCILALREHLAAMPAPNTALLGALREIVKREGAYSRDELQHARNTIDSMEAIAQAAIAQAEQGVDR